VTIDSDLPGGVGQGRKRLSQRLAVDCLGQRLMLERVNRSPKGRPVECAQLVELDGRLRGPFDSKGS